MSAAIVNLRLARKTKRRIDHADAAAENRVRHGRTRAERDAEARAATRAATHLDGHRLAVPSLDGDRHGPDHDD